MIKTLTAKGCVNLNYFRRFTMVTSPVPGIFKHNSNMSEKHF
jgi:hypothetical protein